MARHPNLAWSLHTLAQADPSRLALDTPPEPLTYGTLAESVGGVARWLGRQGLGPGSRVGVLAGRDTPATVATLGCAWAGAAYVPLAPSFPDQRLVELLGIARPDALIAEASQVERVRKLVSSTVTVLPFGSPEHTTFDALDEPATVAAGDLAYLMFTSGTTGRPKAVAVRTGNVTSFLGVMAERYRLDGEDRVSQFFEPGFDLSVFDLFVTLDAGASLHPVPVSRRMAPVTFAAERRLSVWFSVPSTLADLMRLGALGSGQLPDLRLSLFCGEPLPLASARAWHGAAPRSRIDNLYGPTEATVACLAQTVHDPSRDGDFAPPVTDEREVIAIGRPFAGTEAAIHGAGRGFLDAGETGELLLAGEQLAAGYWDEPKRSARSFVELEHPQLGQRRWYRTGDLARRDEQGRFHHLGRTDHQVKLRGQRVELEEVEAHLRAATGIPGVAVVAWPLRQGSALGLVAFLCGCELPVTEVRARLARRLPATVLPRRYVELAELPRNASGKLDRRALVAHLEEAERQVS